MIWVVRKDRCRPKQLLGEHRPNQEVRPSGRSEGQQQVGICAIRVCVTVGATNQEPRLALAAVAPTFEPSRQFG
jgi:hypothetical protein